MIVAGMESSVHVLRAGEGWRRALLVPCVLVATLCASPYASAGATRLDLSGEYAPTGKPSPQDVAYHIETRIVTYGEDGVQIGVEGYALDLRCRTAADINAKQGSCTCEKLTVKRGDHAEVSVPALKGWSYPFAPTSRWYDSQGQVYGIPAGKFANMTDSAGGALPPDVVYQIYSIFLYFHDFSHGLTAGEIDVTRIGQRVSIAPVEPETSLAFGSLFTDGSVFKHDALEIEFKGLSLVDDMPSAILGFESGGSFKVATSPAPNVVVETVGRSRFHGDVYVDLASKWPRRVWMGLTDATRTTMGQQEIGRFVLETTLTIVVAGDR
jgi:hypothetical protein